MLGWIPILGPIIDGIVSVIKGSQNVDVQKYTVDGKVNIEALKASTQIVNNFKDDISVRLARDIILFPTCVWTALVVWDNIILHSHPNWMIIVESFEHNPGLEYLPYAVLSFLFGLQAMKIWRN